MMMVVVATLAQTGHLTNDSLGEFSGTLTPVSIEETPAGLSNAQLLQDLFSRINDFYQQQHSWPRNWKPYNFTDVALNPEDYAQLINGLYWSPHGSNIGIANVKGDQYEVYVKTVSGEMKHLTDGWSIWCDIPTQVCYYHTIAPVNEVDFSSIVVTTN
jgi:hypothetical protein